MANNLKIDEIDIGMLLIKDDIGTESNVTNKTSNSVETFNRTDRNNRYLSGEKDADGVIQLSGKRKGIDCKQWYTIKNFNQHFTIKV